MVPRTPRTDITAAEQAVLELLWDHGEATIRGLTDALYSDPTPANFSSVQKLLERLETKGFVSRKRSDTVYMFQPKVDRRELIGRRLKAVADSLCDGSMTPLLEHLVEARDLTADDRQSLHELLEKLEQQVKTNRKRRIPE